MAWSEEYFFEAEKKTTIIITFIIGIVNNLHTNCFIYLFRTGKKIISCSNDVHLSIYHNIVELTIH